MHWYLVIALINTNDVFAFEYNDQASCMKAEQFVNKHKSKLTGIDIKTIKSITCEQGYVMDSSSALDI